MGMFYQLVGSLATIQVSDHKILEGKVAFLTSYYNPFYNTNLCLMTNAMEIEKNRISSIDMMRGIVMVIMALDHVRDFFHNTAFVFEPTDLTKTNEVLFFTRWITHFCAPTFVFLSGTSIYISLQRKTKKELSRFLLTRGLWLIVLELTVMRFAFFFNFYYDVTFLIIIWVIGADMVLMAALIHLSDRFALALGLIIMFGYSFIGSIPILTGIGFYPITPNFALLESYPILPWLGIMLLGYSAGKLYARDFDAQRRRKILFQLGASAIVLFILLRFINSYGDTAPWSSQKNMVFNIMSFLNLTKYPVSLLFALMALGPVMIVLALLEKGNGTILKAVSVFGRVPLFYFILHFFLIHVAALILFMYMTGKSFSEIDLHFSESFGGITPEGGVTLPWVYVAWIILVIMLYPICKVYDRYKSTHKDWWLSYL